MALGEDFVVVCVSRGLKADGFDEGVKGVGDGAIESVETAATFGRELDVVGERFPEPGRERGIDLVEELQVYQAEAVALR